jgi:hypothetical protein
LAYSAEASRTVILAVKHEAQEWPEGFTGA